MEQTEKNNKALSLRKDAFFFNPKKSLKVALSFLYLYEQILRLLIRNVS